MNAKPTDDAASVDKVSGSSAEARKHSGEKPAWANGLKQMYDSVVEEDIPDSFKDLLSQLDDNDKT